MKMLVASLLASCFLVTGSISAGNWARAVSRSLEKIARQDRIEHRVLEAVQAAPSIEAREAILHEGAVASADEAIRARSENAEIRITNFAGIVLEGEYPGMIGLAMKHPATGQVRIICGATLIASRYVLTAAHCDAVPAKYLYAYIGPPSLNFAEANLVPVKRMIRHPDYESVKDKKGKLLGLKNDVAVAELESSVDRTPIVLAGPTDTQLISDRRASLVLGWGTINTATGASSDVLLWGEVPMRSDEVCAKAYSASYEQSQICAGEGKVDSCWGDSGGPLLDKQTGVQIGVVSYGNGCSLVEYPGVYAKVGALRDFIDPILIPSVASIE